MLTLSIGIPTYQRPDLLKRLIKSITDQKYIDEYKIEILIGDDSKISSYNELEEHLSGLPSNIKLQYQHNQPSKGQNDNVADLINRAAGTYFCLMHDDDFFLEESLTLLLKTIIENENCIVFGKQLLFNNQYDYKKSESVNNYFKRSILFTGKQKDSIAMAMLQQCPNDGYILQTEKAKQIGIRSNTIVGTACDFDFALRAAIITKLDFFYIDNYTTVYAISEESVTKDSDNNGAERKLNIMYEYKVDTTHPEIFHSVMRSDLSMIISDNIRRKNFKTANKYLLNFNYFMRYLWYKPATYFHLFKVLLKL